MSLATRCTSCGTVFRVVQDQLKVSEGWVRCGRCDAVFNALEGLFDLDRDAPPDWTAPPAPDGANVVDLPVGEEGDDGPTLERDPSLVDRIDEQIFGSRRSAFGALTGIGRSERREDFADARFDSVPPDEPALVAIVPGADEPAAEAAALDNDTDAPAFVREAERRSRWEGSGTRKVMALAATLLGVLLIGQVVHQQRDELAVRWPVARPGFQAWCQWAGCELSAPRRIEDLAVESTSLTRGGSAADTFRFSVVLRNRAGLPVALPWLELSLTDANGELVARRALSPKELRVSSLAVAGGTEVNLSALLSAGTARITGYTVELFYP